MTDLHQLTRRPHPENDYREFLPDAATLTTLIVRKSAFNPESGCIEWSGSNDKGYGLLFFTRNGRKKRFRVHRLAYELAHGPIPDGLEICHRCDNPSCLNVAHLFAATHKSNMVDMKSKGRGSGSRGPANKKSRLNEDAVRDIRSSNAAGVSCEKLAARYGITPQATWSVVARKSWRHVQ